MAGHEPTAILANGRKKPEWFFYLAWILLTLVSFPIAFVLTTLVLRFITGLIGDFIYVDGVRHITEDYLSMYVLVPALGLLTGAAQYGLLRRYLPRMGGWVLATAGGWILGMLLIVSAGRLRGAETFRDNIDLVFLVMGFSIGLGQWLMLRRRLPGAGWWIAANLLGWWLLGLTTTSNTINQYQFFVLGLFPGCATAAGLAWLLSRLPSTGLHDAWRPGS